MPNVAFEVRGETEWSRLFSSYSFAFDYLSKKYLEAWRCKCVVCISHETLVIRDFRCWSYGRHCDKWLFNGREVTQSVSLWKWVRDEGRGKKLVKMNGEDEKVVEQWRSFCEDEVAVTGEVNKPSSVFSLLPFAMAAKVSFAIFTRPLKAGTISLVATGEEKSSLVLDAMSAL